MSMFFILCILTCLTPKHVIGPCSERVASPLKSYYLPKFYNNFMLQSLCFISTVFHMHIYQDIFLAKILFNFFSLPLYLMSKFYFVALKIGS